MIKKLWIYLCTCKCYSCAVLAGDILANMHWSFNAALNKMIFKCALMVQTWWLGSFQTGIPGTELCVCVCVCVCVSWYSPQLLHTHTHTCPSTLLQYVS